MPGGDHFIPQHCHVSARQAALESAVRGQVGTPLPRYRISSTPSCEELRLGLSLSHGGGELCCTSMVRVRMMSEMVWVVMVVPLG